MKRESFWSIVWLISFILFCVFFPSRIDENNDWWAKTFCVGEGEYQERFYDDVCIIDGVKYG